MLLKHFLTYTCFSLTESEHKAYVLKKKKKNSTYNQTDESLGKEQSKETHEFQKEKQELPWHPVVKTLRFHCRGHKFGPWLGYKIPHAVVAWPKKKRKIRVKTYILYFRSLNLILISYRREMKLLVF